MHLNSKIEAGGSSLLRGALLDEALKRPPFGPGFTEQELRDAKPVAMEIHGTDFSDPGPDYVEFRLINADGEVALTRRVDGY